MSIDFKLLLLCFTLKSVLSSKSRQQKSQIWSWPSSGSMCVLPCMLTHDCIFCTNTKESWYQLQIKSALLRSCSNTKKKSTDTKTWSHCTKCHVFVSLNKCLNFVTFFDFKAATRIKTHMVAWDKKVVFRTTVSRHSTVVKKTPTHIK